MKLHMNRKGSILFKQILRKRNGKWVPTDALNLNRL